MNAITPIRPAPTVLDTILHETIEISHCAAPDPFALSPRDFLRGLRPVVSVEIDDLDAVVVARLTPDDVAALVCELVSHGAAAVREVGGDAGGWVASIVQEMEGRR